MNKKTRFKTLISTVLIIPFCYSCSDSKNISEEEYDFQTIKNYVTDVEQSTVWSVELEKDRLSAKIGNEVSLNNAKIQKNYKSDVYPLFSDFGSLDISKVDYKYLEQVNKFCEAVAKSDNQTAYACFKQNYKFNYVFFHQDLKKGWKQNFSIDFPELKKSEDDKNEEEEKKPLAPVLFNRWILGEPFINEELVQIPVRFYCNMGFVDVTLYMSSIEESTVYNLKIEKWEKYD